MSDLPVAHTDPRVASALVGMRWMEILDLVQGQAQHIRIYGDCYYEGKQRYGDTRTPRSICRFTFAALPLSAVDEAAHPRAVYFRVGDETVQLRYAHLWPLRPPTVDPSIFVRLVWNPLTGALAGSIEGLRPQQTAGDVLAAWRALRAVARGLGWGGGGRPKGTGEYTARDAFVADLVKAAQSLRGRKVTVSLLAGAMAIDRSTFHRLAGAFDVDWRAEVRRAPL